MSAVNTKFLHVILKGGARSGYIRLDDTHHTQQQNKPYSLHVGSSDGGEGN
jgi:hypothetical protein